MGVRGFHIFGGQKQRVAIARVLLDEATYALDADNEREVQRSLDRAMIGRTTVTVAHRIETIKKATPFMSSLKKDSLNQEPTSNS